MGRTKHFARTTPSAPAHNKNGASLGTEQVAPQPASQDEVAQTEYYPVTLNWTAQAIEQQQQLNYTATLERANTIIAARLAGHFVKEDELAWAKRVGEKELERTEAEEAARKQDLEARRAGKLFTAVHLI